MHQETYKTLFVTFAGLYKPEKLESWKVEKLGQNFCKYNLRIHCTMNRVSPWASNHPNVCQGSSEITESIRKHMKNFSQLVQACAILYKLRKLENWKVEKLHQKSCKFILRFSFDMNGASYGHPPISTCPKSDWTWSLNIKHKDWWCMSKLSTFKCF